MCRVGVAVATSTDASAAGPGDDFHDDQPDQNTADELAGFIAELCDARAETERARAENGRLQDQNERLEDRVSMLTALLDKAAVDTA